MFVVIGRPDPIPAGGAKHFGQRFSERADLFSTHTHTLTAICAI